MTFKSYAIHYAKGLVASAANGAVVAIGAIVGPATMNALGVAVASLTPHQVLAAGIGGAIISGLGYLKAHPFPVDNPDGTPETVLPTASAPAAIPPASIPPAPPAAPTPAPTP